MSNTVYIGAKEYFPGIGKILPDRAETHGADEAPVRF